MAHFRPRHLQAALTKGLKFSPLVALLGHRQVGKTTLGTQIARGYYTLDLRTTSDIIQRDPTGFLESISVFPTVLDETQLLPELFPALKEHVRTHKKPGQFLLTGSVRFSSRKRILESLTGRIIYYELLPLDISEARERPLPRCLIDLADRFESVELKKTSRAPSLVSQYLRKGGLPGLFAIRDESLFIQKIDTQIETILERDLRLLVDTALSFQTLRGLYTHLALHQGEPLDLMAISRATRVSRPTIRKLLQAYSSLFLIRFLPVEGTAKKGTFYLEDQGEASHRAHSFLKFYKRGKIVFATAGQKASSPSPRMRVIPIALLI
ncbi:MAG: ATP-binding protein [Deltaproteobacteria bacterium]|nr:ATP-binding protein [Deltaproteobacteria bacterium]